jgi:hypothetical protein
MDKDGKVTGSVTLRPARVGIAVEPTFQSVRSAVEKLVGCWGGYFCPILDSTQSDIALRMADHMSLDAIWSIDDSEGPKSLASAPGFRWRDFEKGPFDRASEGRNDSLLSPEWALHGNLGGPRSFPDWDREDELADVFFAWFGRYPHDSPMIPLFSGRSSRVHLSDGNALTAGLINFTTPIKATALGILHKGALGSRAGLIQVDAENPRDIMLFWNLRAAGVNIFPLVRGHEQRLERLFDAWFGRALRLHRESPADASNPQVLSYWGQDELARNIAERVSNSVGGDPEVIFFYEQGASFDGPRHVISTGFSRTFAVSKSSSERVLSIPLPLGPQIPYGGRDENGIVAADIDFYTENNLGEDVVASLPYLRTYSHAIDTMRNSYVGFDRVSPGGGRVSTVSISSHEVEVGLASTSTLFQHILGIGGWGCKRSDGGRLIGRVLEMLGGAEVYPGNQPSLRRVLDEAARSSNGRRLPALIETAKRHKGEWPGPFQARPDDYAKNVVYHLLLRKLLQPFLEIRCPKCGTKDFLRPADLAAEIECEICAEKYPLGFALGVAPGGRNDWVYRLTGNLSAEKIAEIMPVVAVLSVLSAALGRNKNLTHSFGLIVNEGKWKCEIDVAFIIDWSERPLVVVGEVKSYRDAIDLNDLENLTKVQGYLRSNGFECVILVATLRERFADQEVIDIRSVSQQVASGRRGSSINPLLPLVLTESDLSLPYGHEKGLDRWDSRFNIFGLAEESCRKNIGLTGVRPIDRHGDGGSEITWETIWGE